MIILLCLQGTLCPVLTLLVQETSISWSESSRLSLRWLGARAHGVWGETENLFGLWKTRQRIDLIIIFHYLLGVYRKDEVRLLSGVHRERQEGTVALSGSIHLDIKKKLSIIILVKQRDRLPREVVDLSLEIFRTWLDSVPSDLTQLWCQPCFEKEMGQANLQKSLLTWIILWFTTNFLKASLWTLQKHLLWKTSSFSNFNHLKNRLGNLKNVKLNPKVIYRTWCLLLVKSVIARNHYTGWCGCHFDRWSKDERTKLLPCSQFV